MLAYAYRRSTIFNEIHTSSVLYSFRFYQLPAFTFYTNLSPLLPVILFYIYDIRTLIILAIRARTPLPQVECSRQCFFESPMSGEYFGRLGRLSVKYVTLKIKLFFKNLQTLNFIFSY